MATREEILKKLREGPPPKEADLNNLDTDSISFGRVPEKRKTAAKTETGEELLRKLREGYGQESFQDQTQSAGAMLLRGVNNITLPPARFLGSITGDVRIGPDGAEIMSPEEARREQSPGGSLSIDREPEGFVEHGMEFAGETIALTGPFARTLSFVPSTAKTGLLAKAQNFIREMGTSALSRPGSALAMEGVSGFGAGAGGEIATDMLGDTPAVRFVGNILGGVATPLPTLTAAVAARKYLMKKFEPYSEAGGSLRGRKRFERSVAGEDRTAGLRGLDEPTTRDAAGEFVLSPAQRTGLPGPMAMEKSVMQSSDELAHLADEKLAHANKVLREDLSDLAEQGTSADAQEYLMYLFDTRLRAAALRVKERLSTLGPKADRKSANLIFDEELRRVTKVVDDQIDQLFAGLPKDATVPTSATVQKYRSWKDEMGNTGARKIPSDVRKFLDPVKVNSKGKEVKNPQYLGEVTTLGELRTLQTSLREHARSVMKDSPTSARIANDIADSITDDLARMQAVPEVRDRLNVAVDFTRDANAILGKFKLGQMGGRSYTITNRPVAPELSAERSIGLGGQEGRQAYDQIIDLIKKTRVPQDALMSGGESPAAIQDAARQYFRSRFLEESINGGQVNMAQARAFLKRHRPVLEVLPELRQEITDVLRSNKALEAMQKRAGEAGSAKVAKAAMLIHKDPIEVFRGLIKSNPKNVAKEVQGMLNAVNKDELGFAQRGLKSAWIDFLFTAGKTGGRDVQQRQLLSGAAIDDVLKSPQGKIITERLFPSNKDRQKLRRVVNDLKKLEMRRSVAASKEGVLKDKPNNVMQKLLGFVGAGLGRAAGRATGTGGTVQQPGYGADFLRELGEHSVRDPALRTIFAGIEEEGMWRNVLMKPLTPDGEIPKEARRRLNAWAATVLYEQGVQERFDPGEQQEEPQEPRRDFAPGY